jgi:hypothetical protein
MKKSKSETPLSSGDGRARAARAASKRRTHFVPRVVFRTAFAGVVPVCVAASGSDCGGLTRPDATPNTGVGMGAFVPDATSNTIGVGMSAFGVANTAFVDASTDDCLTWTEVYGLDGAPLGQASTCHPSPTCSCDFVALMAFGVANMAFDGGGLDGVSLIAFTDASGAPDGSSDASDEDEGSFGEAGLDANAPDGGVD